MLSVNGYWQPWQDWKHCNVSCGGGTQVRDRVCVEPLHGGETCPGPNEEITDCNTHPCPGVSCVSDDTMALQHTFIIFEYLFILLLIMYFFFVDILCFVTIAL